MDFYLLEESELVLKSFWSSSLSKTNDHVIDSYGNTYLNLEGHL